MSNVATAALDAQLIAPREVYLHPGDLHVAAEPTTIATLLGSCVSVCLWDATMSIGAMNHFMLAAWNGMGPASNRYGNVAIDTLLESMAALGVRRRNLQGMVFGGGNVVAGLPEDEVRGIGAQNISAAITMLAALTIPIVVKDVGGRRGRKIRFDTFVGKASVEVI